MAVGSVDLLTGEVGAKLVIIPAAHQSGSSSAGPRPRPSGRKRAGVRAKIREPRRKRCSTQGRCRHSAWRAVC